MPVSEKTFRRVALDDPEGHWELYCGELRSKPGMTVEHNDLMGELGFALRHQLDRAAFRVRVNSGHARRSEANYFIPDVMVIPTALEQEQRGTRDLETYTSPLPLVVEIWSPSTGRYDARDKLPEYQRRGDAEIWFIHPYERTLTAWRRRADGGYDETLQRSSMIHPVALPGVAIDLDALFAEI
jgi:Uma2 family endonuclease